MGNAGAGQAGYQVASSLRQEGFTGSIVLVGDEPGVPYQRPPLSKAYLLGKADVESLALRVVVWQLWMVPTRGTTALGRVSSRRPCTKSVTCWDWGIPMTCHLGQLWVPRTPWPTQIRASVPPSSTFQVTPTC